MRTLRLDLTGADVRNALFMDADVSRANFRGALLQGHLGAGGLRVRVVEPAALDVRLADGAADFDCGQPTLEGLEHGVDVARTRFLAFFAASAALLALLSVILAGKGAVQILDTMQLAIADLLLETGDGRNFSMPQHCFQYTNTSPLESTRQPPTITNSAAFVSSSPAFT